MSRPAIRARRSLVVGVQLVAAIAVSTLAFAWAFRGVDLVRVGANLGRVSGGAIAAYVAIQSGIHAVRVCRYWLLIQPMERVAHGSRGGLETFRIAFVSASVGIPASVFLPLRLGELVRPALVARSGIPMPQALASVVVERLADGIFNVAVFFVLLAILPATFVAPEVRSIAISMLMFFGGGIAILLAGLAGRERVLGTLASVLGRISGALAERVVQLVSTFLDGARALGSPARAGAFLGSTATYWLMNGLSVSVLIGSYGVDLPIIAGPFAIVCAVFAVTIPAGPAFAGTLEAGFRFGLGPFDVAPSDIAAIAVLVHILQLVLLAAFAAIGMATGITPRASEESPLGIPRDVSDSPVVDARDR